MITEQYQQQGTIYGDAPSTGSPISGGTGAIPADTSRTDLLRVLSRLDILERDLSRARHRIQQLETAIGLIEQRVNSRLS
jgi:hypothetical protein